jgi:hypothetical protein
MRSDPRVEKCIADALAGSGLPVDRRSQIAEELAYHLDQSVASKCEAGLNDEQAVEAALPEFGSPEVIRKQLRRRQRMADRRQAIAEVRRQLWRPIACAAFFLTLILVVRAVFARETNSLGLWCLGGASVFVSFLALTAGSTYAGAIVECRIRRQRRRSEYHFLRSCLQWMALAALGLASLVFLALLELVACAPLLGKIPFTDHFPQLLWLNFGVVWLESAGRNFRLRALGILGCGLMLALYERSQCVDEPAIPAAG